MNFLGYLCAAYSIIFVAIFLYVAFIWRRQAQLLADLRMLETRLRDMHEERDAHLPESRSAL
ncbi:MAG: CcmD family protein [Candidatus Binataceae bacterium]